MAGFRPITSPVFRMEPLVTILDAAPILSRVGSRIYLEVQRRQSRLVLVWDLLRKIKMVKAVCVEPHSYMVRLVDGRDFRRTRWAINLDYSSLSLSAPSPSLCFPLVSVAVFPNWAGSPVGPAASVPAQLLPASTTPVPPLSGIEASSHIMPDSLDRTATTARLSSPGVPVAW